MDYIHSPWNSPGQDTGVGSLSLLQGIFLTQGLNPGLPHCRGILYQPQGNPAHMQYSIVSVYHLFFIDLSVDGHLGCFPDSSAGKEFCCNAGDPSSIPGSGRSAGEGNGNPFQAVFLPGKFHGQRSLVWTEEPGRLYSMGWQGSDMTD